MTVAQMRVPTVSPRPVFHADDITAMTDAVVAIEALAERLVPDLDEILDRLDRRPNERRVSARFPRAAA